MLGSFKAWCSHCQPRGRRITPARIEVHRAEGQGGRRLVEVFLCTRCNTMTELDPLVLRLRLAAEQWYARKIEP